jgi:hypothetical protein
MSPDPQHQKLFRRPADDLTIPPIDQEKSTVQFTLNDADPRLLEDAGKTLLAGAKRFLHPNPVRGLDNCDEHTANAGRSLFVRYWAVANGKSTVFPIRGAASLDLNEKVFGKEGSTRSVQNCFMQGPELRLHFRPCLMKGKAESRWMFVAED